MQAEQALQALNADLENRVEQRTADFRRAMEEAERANAAKSEFLSRMSHELRTPLNAILGFGQLLETDPEAPLSEAQQCNVSEILHAGHHLLDMINEVLDLARCESGRIEVSMEALALSEVLDSCAAQIRPLMEQRGLSMRMESSNAWVIADRTRLKQIILNLLLNAVKYNYEGGCVSIENSLITDDRVRISITDTGPGITPDQRDRLFHPFERLESAYQGIEGTGIGPALSKRLTEAMNGRIGVDSTLAEGSTFWVEFPACPADLILSDDKSHPIASTHTASTSQATTQTMEARRRRLLYIEDNPANMKLVRKAVGSKSNLALIEATTAEEGIRIADREQPEVILLDINLPGMNGYEALKVLRANPELRNTRIIGLSANAMHSDIERAKMAGFSDYLTKPIDINLLLITLEPTAP